MCMLPCSCWSLVAKSIIMIMLSYLLTLFSDACIIPAVKCQTKEISAILMIIDDIYVPPRKAGFNIKSISHLLVDLYRWKILKAK